MRVYEMTQHAVDGGHPCPNDGPFDHGEPVVIVSKRELATLAYHALELSPAIIPVLQRLKALGDDFVCPLCEPLERSPR